LQQWRRNPIVAFFANGFRGEAIEAFLLFPVFVTAVLAFYIFNNNTGIA
jgi:hypothetical protein